MDLSFNNIWGTKNQWYPGTCWRLESVKIEAICLQGSNQDGALLQVGLHSGGNPNVENIALSRFLVGPGTPKSRVLRMRQPNPWKEDEERKQFVCSIHSVQTPTANSNQISVYLEARIKFLKIPFTPTTKVTAFHSDYPPSPSSSFGVLPEEY